jgi:hypothetical protein
LPRDRDALCIYRDAKVYWKRKRFTSVKRPKLRKAAWDADHS